MCSTARVLVCVELTVEPAGDAMSANVNTYDVPVEKLTAYYINHHSNADRGFQNLFNVRLIARPLCLFLCLCVRLQASRCTVLLKELEIKFLTPPSRVPLVTC